MGFRDHPRRLRWRKVLFQIHLWTGIAVGLYLLLIGITGSALVFREEMEHALYHDLMEPSAGAYAEPHPGIVAERLRKQFPDYTLTSVFLPGVEIKSVFAYLRKDGRYMAAFVDPAGGGVLGTVRQEESFLRWLQDLHFNLLSGATGRIVNGVGALFLLLLCMTGLVVWWPGIRNWRRGLTVDFSKKWKRVNWDLHSAAGFWTAVLLLMWAVTGAYCAWPREFAALVNCFSPVSVAAVPKPDPRAPAPTTPPPPLDALLAEARMRSPGAKLAGVVFPASAKGNWVIYMAREAVGEYETTDYHYFDPRTGKHLAVWRRGLSRSTGDVVMGWLGPLHFGNFGGIGLKILWVILGLTPPVLFVTGFLMYWNRSLSKKWARWRSAEVMVQPGDQLEAAGD